MVKSSSDCAVPMLSMIAISACMERKHKPEYSPFKNLFSVQRLKLYLSMRSVKPLYWPSIGSFSLTHKGIDFVGFLFLHQVSIYHSYNTVC